MAVDVLRIIRSLQTSATMAIEAGGGEDYYAGYRAALQDVAEIYQTLVETDEHMSQMQEEEQDDDQF